MSTIAQLVENWERDDPRLAPGEKETTIRFARDEDRAIVHTDEAGLGRRLLAHPDSEVVEVAVLDDGRVRRVTLDEVERGDEPVGVRVTLPIGALSVRSSSRKSDRHAQVVSDRVLDGVGKPEPVTDGGRYVLPNIGSRVVDREEGDELLVVELHEQTGADRYEIGLFGETTVAEENPHYDPSAPVVEAVYIDDVEETLDNWRSVEDVRDAVAFDALTAYSFPADRLRGVGE